MDHFAVNYHILAPCNMSCGGCFAHFHGDSSTGLQPPMIRATIRRIGYLARNYKLRKMTFSGGEPTLLKELPDYLAVARDAGFITCLITNGSRLTPNLMRKIGPNLDWLGLSVDSLDSEINRALGRVVSGVPLEVGQYSRAVTLGGEWGCQVKINTVVSRLNMNDLLASWIDSVQPTRWKIMEWLEISGENDTFRRMRVTQQELERYCSRNRRDCMVVETARSMVDSYFMISPSGRIVSNSHQMMNYSASVHDMDTERFEQCYTTLAGRLRQRGGVYQWSGVGGKVKDMNDLRPPLIRVRGGRF